MIERGSFYVADDFMIVAHDYERVDGYGRVWNRVFSNKEHLEIYCNALRDCGYKNMTGKKTYD